MNAHVWFWKQYWVLFQMNCNSAWCFLTIYFYRYDMCGYRDLNISQGSTLYKHKECLISFLKDLHLLNLILNINSNPSPSTQMILACLFFVKKKRREDVFNHVCNFNHVPGKSLAQMWASCNFHCVCVYSCNTGGPPQQGSAETHLMQHLYVPTLWISLELCTLKKKKQTG